MFQMSSPGATVRSVEAATWTAIAILAGAVLGTLFYLGARIDSLGARLDARLDSVGARLDARIEAQAGEIRDLRVELSTRLDAVVARLDEHIRRHAG